MKTHLKVAAATCWVIAILLFGYGNMMSLTHGHEQQGERLITQSFFVILASVVLAVVAWLKK